MNLHVVSITIAKAAHSLSKMDKVRHEAGWDKKEDMEEEQQDLSSKLPGWMSQ